MPGDDGRACLPIVAAFPQALGTGILIRSDRPLGDDVTRRLRSLIDGYESVLSRFRADSTVTAMGGAVHGGTFEFPAWAGPLLDLVDALDEATEGGIDPCVGEDLIRLGYGADLSFRVEPDAARRLGSLHGRPTWRRDVRRDGVTLRTRGPVHLDFGCCGKGHVVDLLVRAVLEADGEQGASGASGRVLLVDAGGDIRVRTPEPRRAPRHVPGAADDPGPGTAPRDGSVAGAAATLGTAASIPAAPITVALEDPHDESLAVGVAEPSAGSLCASAPSRRHWTDAAHHRLHHLLDAASGLPVEDVAATWTAVEETASPIPTAVADGLATALFVSDPGRLAERWGRATDGSIPFSCLVLRADGRAVMGGDFPGRLFLRRA